VQDSEQPVQNVQPFALLGLLATYNMFEFQNPYKTRLDDFVNETIIRKIIYCVGSTCTSARDEYIEVQDDLPEGWSLSSTLGMVGLGSLAGKPAPPPLTPEEMKARFIAL
jgi:hypothetical protein